MKKYLPFICAALLCVCCMGLVACGGSSAPADDNSKSPAEVVADVSSDLRAAGEELTTVVNELVAFAEKAVDEGSFDASSQEYQDLKSRFDTMTNKVTQWTDNMDTLSDKDLDYVKKVILPNLAKGAGALSDLLKLL